MVHPRLKRIVSENSSAASSPTPDPGSDSGKPDPESEEQDPEPGVDEHPSDAERGPPAALPESDGSGSGMEISDEDFDAPSAFARRGAGDAHGADMPAAASPPPPPPTSAPPPPPSASASAAQSAHSHAAPAPRTSSPPSHPDSAPPSAPRSPAQPPARPTGLKIKLKLGARPPQTGENAHDAKALKFTLPPPRASQGSSRRASSRSQSSHPDSAESEEADDADAEWDGDGPPAAAAMDVDEAGVPDLREAAMEDVESEGADFETDEGAEEDVEVLPGGRRGGRLTARQAVLASMVGAEHVELEAATSSRKKQLTSEEIALRREETARKRKNMSEKKLEDEKTETINRLLKKQSSRSRAKRSALLASVVPTPQSPHSGEDGESGEGAGAGAGDGAEARGAGTVRGPAWRWVSSRAGIVLGVPREVVELHVRGDTGLGARPPAVCDVAGCGERRKYRVMPRELGLGACGLRHFHELGALAGKAEGGEVVLRGGHVKVVSVK